MLNQWIAEIFCKDLLEENESLFEETVELEAKLQETKTELDVYKEKFDWIFYPKQESDLITSASLIRRKIKEQLPADFGRNIIIPDPREKLVDLEYFKEWIKENPIDKRQYIVAYHDCNTFSTILKGDVKKWDSELAFGEVYIKKPNGTGHAVNVLVDTNLKLWIVEPQTDEIFEFPEDWIPYTDLRF